MKIQEILKTICLAMLMAGLENSAYGRDLSQAARSYSRELIEIGENIILGGFGLSAVLLIFGWTKDMGMWMLRAVCLGSVIIFGGPSLVGFIRSLF